MCDVGCGVLLVIRYLAENVKGSTEIRSTSLVKIREQLLLSKIMSTAHNMVDVPRDGPWRLTHADRAPR